MKRPLIALAVAVLGMGHAHAKLELTDYKYFNHLSLGLSLGTDGIGFDVSAPMTSHFAVRAGATFMPKIKYNTSVNIGSSTTFLPGVTEVDIQGKPQMGNFHLLFDYYPFKKSSFRLTAGAYIGKKAIATVANTKPFLKEDYWGSAGIELGQPTPIYNQYSVISDNEGNIKLDMTTNVFKPYIGLGFGRAIPKRRVNVTFDMGVQFWGTPGISTNVKYFDYEKGDYVTNYEKLDRRRITTTNSDFKDIKDVIKHMEVYHVYPVIKLTINGRIF